MAAKNFPSVFVSHGAPTIAQQATPATAFLKGLGVSLGGIHGRPKAVLCVSAHWETEKVMTSAAPAPETIHDFFGFPDPLYQLKYPAPGAPELAGRVVELLEDQNIPCAVSTDRGLDHGAWMPMMFMYPEADVPVTQLSIQPDQGPGAHLALGRALAPLRGEGVLVLASGSAVHNLGFFRSGSSDVADWARRFDDWLAATVEAGDAEALVDYRTSSPDGVQAHPRDEHFLPLLVALGAGAGAGGKDAKGRTLHRSFMDGALSMAAFAFE
ncbi:MAG: dioxygenase [Rhodospirillales bacterium]|nr:dioxygenase [Rhodospirillales bacterium]